MNNKDRKNKLGAIHTRWLAVEKSAEVKNSPLAGDKLMCSLVFHAGVTYFVGVVQATLPGVRDGYVRLEMKQSAVVDAAQEEWSRVHARKYVEYPDNAAISKQLYVTGVMAAMVEVQRLFDRTTKFEAILKLKRLQKDIQVVLGFIMVSTRQEG